MTFCFDLFVLFVASNRKSTLQLSNFASPNICNDFQSLQSENLNLKELPPAPQFLWYDVRLVTMVSSAKNKNLSKFIMKKRYRGRGWIKFNFVFL